MAKSDRKKAKVEHSAGQSTKGGRRLTKIREYVGYLSELHRLQRTLLAKLRKEVGDN
jgi:hypothetical protein